MPGLGAKGSDLDRPTLQALWVASEGAQRVRADWCSERSEDSDAGSTRADGHIIAEQGGRKGLPASSGRGGSLSPLLAAVMLIPSPRPCTGYCGRPIKCVHEILGRLGLHLHGSKRLIGKLSKGFYFLGYRVADTYLASKVGQLLGVTPVRSETRIRGRRWGRIRRCICSPLYKVIYRLLSNVFLLVY